ncbi:MAG: Ig-like domain-containing protein [Chloroflexota bacterium]
MKKSAVQLMFAPLLALIVACQGDPPAETVTTPEIGPTIAATLTPAPETAVEAADPTLIPTIQTLVEQTQLPVPTVPVRETVSAENFWPAPFVRFFNYKFITSNADPNQAINITFSEPMDRESVMGALNITPAPIAPFEAEWGPNDREVSLNFAEPLDPNAQYVIRVEKTAVNKRGIPMISYYGSRFKPLHNQTTSLDQPRLEELNSVVSNAYSIGSSDAAGERDFIIEFAVLVDQQSAEEAFFIEPTVPGSFAWDGNQMIFKTSGGEMGFSAAYQFGLTPQLKAAEGTPLDGASLLEQTFAWAFTYVTWYGDSIGLPLRFGFVPNIQAVDENGRRAIEFYTYSRFPQQINASLYPLTVDEFNVAWANHMPEQKYVQDRVDIPLDLSPAREWQFETLSRGDEKFPFTEAIIPADVPVGIYILEISDGFAADAIFVTLSANRLTVKGSYGEIAGQLTSTAGEPVPNAVINLHSRNGSNLGQIATDQAGTFRLPLPEAVDWANQDRLNYVVARAEGDVVTARFEQPSLYRKYEDGFLDDNEWSSIYPITNEWRVFSQTDFPVYRPGQFVNFKAMVRTDADNLFGTPPIGTPIKVTLLGGVSTQTRELETNAFGTVSDFFPLPETINLAYNGGPDIFELQFEVDGEVFKHPVPIQPSPEPPAFDISIQTDQPAYTVGDTAQLEIEMSQFEDVPLDQLEIKVFQFIFDANNSGIGNLFNRWRHVDTLFENRFSPAEYAGNPTFSVEAPSPDLIRTFNAPNPLSMGFLVMIKESNLELEVRKFITVDLFDPNREPEPRLNRPYDLRVSAERNSYAPGETAVLLVESTFSGPALLTVERQSVRRMIPVQLTAPSTRIEFPILETDGPNIAASINAFRPRTPSDRIVLNNLSDSDFLYRQDYAEIKVAIDQKRLNVEIVPNGNPQPGETAGFTVRVTDNDGRPVSAELLLNLTDVNALPMIAYKAKDAYNGRDAFNTFYEPQEHTVASYSSHKLERQFNLEEGNSGRGGSSPSPPDTMRTFFSQDGVWLSEVLTDSNGEAQVRLPIPASASAWRLSVTAITADTQIGEAELIIEAE